MKRKRAEELGQYGYILTGSIFAILAIVGSLLENEFIITLSVLFLLYIPAYVCFIVIWEIRDSQKKKRRKAKRQSKRKSLMCPACEKIFKREELDLLPSAEAFCPDCETKLVPHH